VGVERVRSHSAFLPSDPTPTKASLLPSGEMAKLYGTKDKLGGGSSEERTTGTGFGPAR
jgi:hypothetical protein